MFQAKRPKFKLEFSINDISNIPHTAGYCYIEVLIQDGQQGGFRAAISLLKPVSKIGAGSESETESKRVNSSAPSTTSMDQFSSGSSGNVHVRTSRRKIHNFKCVFNYKLSCNLRFPFKKRDNMVGNKYLLLRLYYVREKSSKTEGNNHTEMGRVELNLAEYLNFNEPVSAKYLLQDSKINSILNMTTSLQELPSDFEFHTLLQIEDSTHSHSGVSTMQASAKAADHSTKSFNVPQFQRKTVFGGLEKVINTPSSANSKATSLSHSSDEDTGKEQKSGRHLKHHKPEILVTPNIGAHTFENVIVDPIVSGLYKKVLESTWDPELHVLLKFSPEKIVDDIFETNGELMRQEVEKDYQLYQEMNKDLDRDLMKEDNGLISEHRFRDNLKSWSVSWA